MDTILRMGLGLIIVASLVFVYLLIIARIYCKPKRIISKKTPPKYSLPAVNVEIISKGKKLSGWVISSEAPLITRDLVILVHGWSCNMSMMLPLAKHLYHSGFDIMLFDCRGHGLSESDGPITLVKMAEDINAAVDFAYQNINRSNILINLVTHSMGASAGILFASSDKRINALVACSPFADPKLVTKRYISHSRIPIGFLIQIIFLIINKWIGTSMDDISPKNRINSIKQDILLVHGEKDIIIPYSDTISLLHNPDKKNFKFLKIENRGHLDILRDKALMENVACFFQSIPVGVKH